MNKTDVINKILEEKVIVIVRGLKDEDIIPFAQAVYDGGIRAIELTYNASNPDEDVKNADNIKRLVEHFGDKMLIGAGTVLKENQVELTKKAGGQFIISPDANLSIIKKTCELGMVSIPGALTPTEVQAAHLAGADFVKLFPINVLGAGYVKDLKAPLSHIKMLAVGGINENNIEEFLKAGAVGFGIGSNIVNKQLIEAGDFKAITNLAKNFLAKIK